MTTCLECENELNIDVDEIAEGDVVTCDECGTEYEVVGVEPLELARVDDDLDEDDDDLLAEDLAVRVCWPGWRLPLWRLECFPWLLRVG
jgi:alpha-aminoadipate carrier protein LysW